MLRGFLTFLLQPHAIPWTESDRVLFCDVHGHEERVDTSVRNMHEVDVVSRVVNFLCRSLDENATIGVISFYAAQGGKKPAVVLLHPSRFASSGRHLEARAAHSHCGDGGFVPGPGT